MNMLARVNVLIVTYKQHDVIGRNIESILNQKEFGLNQIIICDDHSPDNNWEVINSYVEKYPDLITAYRNEKNLGIYGNSDKCASLHGDAELFCWIEGDDSMCEGALERLQKFLNDNKVDLSQPCGICFDWASVDKDGEYIVRSNKMALSGYNYIGLWNRGLLSWRGSFFTKSVIEKFTPTKLDMGLTLAENLFDMQWLKYSKKLYYCPGVATLYYTNIGVSVDLGEGSDYRGKERVAMCNYFIDNKLYANGKDFHWLSYLRAKAQFQETPNLALIISANYHFIFGNYWKVSNQLRSWLAFNHHSLKKLFK